MLSKPVILSKNEHPVSQDNISQSALKVLTRLTENGFQAFLVGGGVRDILTGIQPKDFDVATNAEPEQVRALFKNSRIIGRRFRLVHVVFGREIIEVATFRAGHDNGAGGEVGDSGRILRDNVFGTIEQDAERRDFTVNALYYNMEEDTVTDFVGGINDIDERMFRLIGDPVVRCEEDPVRVIRAARLSAKLDFDIDQQTQDAMWECAGLLDGVPAPRLFEEVLKLFQGGYAVKSFEKLEEHDLLGYLFPGTSEFMQREPEPIRTMIISGLANTDKRVGEQKPITPSYLLAFLLWPEVHRDALELMSKGSPAVESIMKSADNNLPQQLRVTSIPRRFSGPMREIWCYQPRLEQFIGQRALDLLGHRRFRAAYDFLCLRASVDSRLKACCEWWTRVQEAPEQEQVEMSHQKKPVDGDWKMRAKPKKRRNTRRKAPRKKASGGAG